MNNRYLQKLEELKAAGNYRSFPVLNPQNIDLCSNDYLGMAHHREWYFEFIGSYEHKSFPLSASSSRLLSGNSPEHTQLEHTIKTAYQREACLLFNSGYHANIGILPALTYKADLIIADKLVHASLIDGARLSEATFMRYGHLNYDHLEQLLTKHRKNYDQVFIVSESIFSMDGDVADLKKLASLKQKFNCFLYVDEAHAVGTNGKNGLGICEEQDLVSEIDFIVGTFGKALASVGAYVICDELYKNFMINHSRSLIFTTALPPINLAWTNFVFERLSQLNALRDQLVTLSKYLSNALKSDSQSHIVPFMIGENHEATAVSNHLKENGFNALPVRYPTVPKGTARLRFSLRADLSIEQLEPLIQLLGK